MKHEYSAEFLLWFAAFPRPTAKFAAFIEWERQQPIDHLKAIATLKWQCAMGELSKDRRFCPYARTYLHQRRFEDEPPQKRESEPTPIAETLPQWMEAKVEKSKGFESWTPSQKAELKWAKTGK